MVKIHLMHTRSSVSLISSDVGITKKTKIDYKGGQHPVWDSELRFSVKKGTAKKYRELEVSCFAKEHRDDTLLGEARVDMTPTLKSGEFDGMC